MDPSALIFVALAVAWAVYLVPKALRDHDNAVRTRSVDRFSHTMRVLARREPVDARSARLVVTPGRPASEVKVVTKPSASGAITPPAAATPAAPAAPVLTPARLRVRRAAAKRATKRRRVVLAALLVATLAVVAVAALGVVPGWSVAIPVGLLAAWLVACRLMVKGERAALAPRAVRPSAPRVPGAVADEHATAPEAAPEVAPEAAPVTVEADGDDPMVDTSAGLAAIVDPTLWDPVPVTLPTYVSKPPAARRSVRTIDLDGDGVWTSGRTDADAQLAREAEQADRAARQQRDKGADQRAVGS